MNDLPRKILRDLVAEFGNSLHEDPRLCASLLKDYCAIHKREINVLIAALKERVAATLLESSNGSFNFVSVKLEKRLCDNLALSEEAAKWAVESWAIALQIIDCPNSYVEPNTVKKKEFINCDDSGTNVPLVKESSFSKAIEAGRKAYYKQKGETPQNRVSAHHPAQQRGKDDPLFMNALSLAIEQKYASLNLFQKRLRITNERAAEIIAAMKDEGYISRYHNKSVSADGDYGYPIFNKALDRKNRAATNIINKIESPISPSGKIKSNHSANNVEGREDSMFCHALVICVDMNQLPFLGGKEAYTSTNILKRQLRISQQRAGAIIYAMVREGLIDAIDESGRHRISNRAKRVVTKYNLERRSSHSNVHDPELMETIIRSIDSN